MEIRKIPLGQLSANCYLVWDISSKEAVIIDPGESPEYIAQILQEIQITPKFILATHGHFDHIRGVTGLKLIFQIPFLANKKDEFLIKRVNHSAQFWLGETEKVPIPEIDRKIKEGAVINFGANKLEVIETAGHTPGSVCFYSKKENLLFSGDTIFFNGVGRIDYKYASEKDLKISLQKLFALPEKTIILPGHGTYTTVKEEKSRS